QQRLEQEYYLETQVADPETDVPVLLENNALADTFSGITSMYAMPRYNEIDPTPLLAPFYWIFFGMMGADVGYGLLLLVLSALVLKFVPLQEGMRKNLKFFFYLSISLVIWGFIYGSFMGGLIPLKGLIDTNKDFTTLLILSLIMGMIHLFFGLGIKGYMLIRDKKYMDTVYDVLFWFMAIVGGIVFLLAIALALDPILKTTGKWVMIAGMLGIVAFAGRESESIGGRLGTGLYELYGISSYVGDFVSYSRLMALGLSGGFIALSINIIVNLVIDKGIFGLVAGVIIFVVFHLFNIFLSMLSAYVHTSRLTYVEFFGKFYEGGGKAFKLFKTQPKYIDIKNTQGGKL
ncbi:MAG: V-type ATP synthase subunit I, partial [Tissierellia bacterium]|nr:V-type ATP synthase subunit I [Tissierellia bacterium]